MFMHFKAEDISKPPGPSCQVMGCFEPASVYVVIKETDVDPTMISAGFAELQLQQRDDRELNTFKLILHLCSRHDYDFKYLLGSNELGIAKRRHLALRESQ